MRISRHKLAPIVGLMVIMIHVASIAAPGQVLQFMTPFMSQFVPQADAAHTQNQSVTPIAYNGSMVYSAYVFLHTDVFRPAGDGSNFQQLGIVYPNTWPGVAAISAPGYHCQENTYGHGSILCDPNNQTGPLLYQNTGDPIDVQLHAVGACGTVAQIATTVANAYNDNGHLYWSANSPWNISTVTFPPCPNPIGSFDLIDGQRRAAGWACDYDNFNQPLNIQFYVNAPAGQGGVYVGAAAANQNRADVASLCGGNPNHGFWWDIPAALQNGQVYQLYAYAINIGPGDRNPLLPGSPRPFQYAPLAQCQDGVDNDGDGQIDMADPGCSAPTDNNEGDETVDVGTVLTCTLGANNVTTCDSANTNYGPAVHYDATTVMNAPAGYTWTSAVAPHNCTGFGTVQITCPSTVGGNHAVGAVGHINATATPNNASVCGALTFSNALNANITDPNQSNNQSQSTVNITCPVTTTDLSLTKTATQNTIVRGDDVVYNFSVQNNGTIPALNVSVTDPLPAGMTYVSSSGVGVTCSGTTTVTCQIGTVPAGGSIGFQVVAHVPAPTGVCTGTSTAVNSATVNSTTGDPSSSNNIGQSTVTLTCPVVTAQCADNQDNDNDGAIDAADPGCHTDGNPANANSYNPSDNTEANDTTDLSLTKSANPTTVVRGTDVTYALSVHNGGSVAALNVVVTDPLPAGMTFISSSGGNVTCSGSTTVTCQVGTVTAGSTTGFQIVAHVPAPTGVCTGTSTASNSATVNSTTGDPSTSNNVGQAAITLTCPTATAQCADNQDNDNDGAIDAADPGCHTDGNPANAGSYDPSDTSEANGTTDLSMTKTANTSTIVRGNDVTYTLTVHNGGSVAALNVSVSDPLPAGMTYVTSTGNVNCSGSTTVTCQLGTVTAGANVSFQIVAHVPASTGVCTGTSTATNSATVNSTTGDPSTGNNVGQNSITLTCPTATAQCADNQDNDNDGAIDAADPGCHTDGDPGNSNSYDANDNSEVNGTTDLSLTKSASPTTVVRGNDVTYTFSVHNGGSVAAFNVAVSDPLPAGMTYVTSTGNVSCSGSTTVTCQVGTVTAGATVQFQVVAHVPAPTGTCSGTSTATNSATVTSTTGDPSTGNNVGQNTVTLSCPTATTSDLTITKSASPTTIERGQNVTYTLTVHNNGPADATNVQVRDPLQGGLTYVSASGANCQLNGSEVDCALGTLANGATTTITIVAQTPAQQGCSSNALVYNTAYVSSDMTDTVASNNQSQITITLTCPQATTADLSITKSASPTTIERGQNVTYTLTVHNNGPATATNVQVRDPLQGGLTYVSANGANCQPNGSEVDCNLGSMNSGATVTITIVAQTPTQQGCSGNALVYNTAYVSSSMTDPVSSNNQSQITVTLTCPQQQSTDVSVQKSGPSSANRSQTVTYTVTVTNNGQIAAQNVRVIDPVPGELIYQSSSVSGAGSCSWSNFVVTCNLGTLAPGESRSMQLTYQPQAITGGCYQSGAVNTATVSTDTPDTNSGNNQSTVSTTLVCQ